MAKKEIQLSEFSVFEKMIYHIFASNLDVPLISFNACTATISECACKLIGAKKGERIVFSERKGVYYVAILPFNSSIKGYSVFQCNNTRHHYCSIKTVISRGMPKEYYKILSPIFVGGVDWFELEVFAKN